MQCGLTAQPIYLQGGGEGKHHHEWLCLSARRPKRQPAGHVTRLNCVARGVWMALHASTGEVSGASVTSPILHIVGGCIILQVLWVLYSITDMNQFRRPGSCLKTSNMRLAGRMSHI